jgi:hypothetical protein
MGSFPIGQGSSRNQLRAAPAAVLEIFLQELQPTRPHPPLAPGLLRFRGAKSPTSLGLAENPESELAKSHCTNSQWKRSDPMGKSRKRVSFSPPPQQSLL